MGEIGIPRREFLYDIQFWEAQRILHGYWDRQHPAWERTRLIAYYVRYCMGLGKDETPQTVTQFIKFPWEEKVLKAPQLSDADREQLTQDMMNFHF